MSLGNNYITGFCAVGFCEGKSPVGIISNKPVRVCDFYEECNCDCHKKITRMYESVNEPREVMQNPLYEPAHNIDLSFLDEVDRLIALTGGPGIATEPLQKPSTATPGLWEAGRTFAKTPTGRRQRGQLEAEVLLVCNRFMDGQLPPQVMTPTVIASEIDKDDPPSIGAVNAILYRWRDLGFARIHSKPLAFLGYTPEGLKEGLEYMKARANRKARRA